VELDFHCGADAGREREHGDGGNARIAAQSPEAVAHVPTSFIEEAQANGAAVSFVLGSGLAEVYMGFAAGFFCGEALTP